MGAESGLLVWFIQFSYSPYSALVNYGSRPIDSIYTQQLKGRRMTSKYSTLKATMFNVSGYTEVKALRTAAPTIILVTGLLLLATGCSSPVSRFKGPQGEDMVQVNCSGTLRDWSGCYQAISEACPNGYAIIDRQQQAGAFSMYNMNTGGYDRVNTLTREAVAVCK